MKDGKCGLVYGYEKSRLNYWTGLVLNLVHEGALGLLISFSLMLMCLVIGGRREQACILMVIVPDTLYIP